MLSILPAWLSDLPKPSRKRALSAAEVQAPKKLKQAVSSEDDGGERRSVLQ